MNALCVPGAVNRRGFVWKFFFFLFFFFFFYAPQINFIPFVHLPVYRVSPKGELGNTTSRNREEDLNPGLRKSKTLGIA